MMKRFEAVLLATRWILLPLYLALLAAVIGLYVVVGREVLHLFAILGSANETEIVLLVLGLLDLVLVANLLVMVALSSYETSISPIEAEGEKPEWLGKMNSSDIKVKVSISIVMISVIHLLRAYMNDTPPDQLMLLAGVHLVFVVSTVALGYTSGSKKPAAKAQ